MSFSLTSNKDIDPKIELITINEIRLGQIALNDSFLLLL